ncbi:MAG TPA: putative 4-mercaptohistidine N1-methyltransferase [Verrucomicrobiae bacterium]|jgi:putative 4-mercaptohistidine N1-methyltranferase|nr:putative 4-mercaptohistidine N1-methyltransferase [Verrucomicrobiae bacterium]
MAGNYYDSERAASEYLLLHYGDPHPWRLPFPARCVRECLAASRVPKKARALDLGCAVGASSFELARLCAEVVSIDFSEQFIEIARDLQKRGARKFNYLEEGELTHSGRAVVPPKIDRNRVAFEVGDATALRDDLGKFDVVLMANLIDRVPSPRKLLGQLPALMNRGGQLIITSPYTWMTEYTPRSEWLGGIERGGRKVETFPALKALLSPDFKLAERRDIPFAIREHARKYQLGIAEASAWLRR